MIAKLIAYGLIGLVIGVLAGLFGVGGSSISTPALRVAMGVSPLIALATPLPVTIPTAIAGGLIYNRRGLVDLDVVVWCSLAGVPAVIAGAVATNWISGHWLMILTGIVVMGIGVRFVWSTVAPWKAQKRPKGPPLRSHSTVRSVLIGLFVGFFSGLLANGGGFLLVPAFIFLLGMSMHEAAGTSLVCVAGLALPGTITHWMLGHIDPILMLGLAILIIPSAYLGAQVALRLKSIQVQLLYGLFLVVFSSYFICSELIRAISLP